MSPWQSRILTALLLGPMTRAQLAQALHRSMAWTHVGVRGLLERRMVIRIATPHHITGKLTWRYTLTNTGTRAANERISCD